MSESREINTLLGIVTISDAVSLKNLITKSTNIYEQVIGGGPLLASLREEMEGLNLQVDSFFNYPDGDRDLFDVPEDTWKEFEYSLRSYFERVIPYRNDFFNLQWNKYEVDVSRYDAGYYWGLAGAKVTGRYLDQNWEPEFVFGYMAGHQDRYQAKLERFSEFDRAISIARDVVTNLDRHVNTEKHVGALLERAQESAISMRSGLAEQKTMLREIETQAKNLESSLQDEIARIRESISDTLRLAQPRRYWRKRVGIYKKETKIADKRFNCGFSIILLSFLSLAVAMVWSTGESISSLEDAFSYMAGKAVVLAIPSILAIWWLRISARDALSKRHIFEDAKHRLVLLDTYLALLSDEKKAMTIEERQIVLAVLFQSIEDGLVHTDPTPFVWNLGGRGSKES